MKIIGVNGSPRKNGNTAQMLEHSLSGAKEAGAEIERIDLFDLNFTGCKSCFACKVKGTKPLGRCVLRDGLAPVLESILAADGLIIASPIYFGDVTGLTRCMLERLWFPSLMYSKTGEVSYEKQLKVGLIYTMNVEDYAAFGYDRLIDQNESMCRAYLGPTETVLAVDTLQFSDYSKYYSEIFDEQHKREVHRKQFPIDCKNAFELGKRLACKE